MARLLIVHHSPTPLAQSLADTVIAGADHPDLAEVEVIVKQALEATIDDVLAADGYLLGTTANFGYMSGALKHFFDTTFNAAVEKTAKRPFGLWVHGRHDTTGAVRSVLSITTGLGWTQAADVVEVIGEISETHTHACRELSGTLAAVLL
ncbi:NAD(P)H-dependent oxidoreductase [soil metagenome]